MIKDIIRCLRPQQWAKNIVLFAGLIFSQNFFDPSKFLIVAATFFLYSMAASGLYVVNDISDVAQDRNHPVKKFRPIASGRIKICLARPIAFTLILVSLTAAWLLNGKFFFLLGVYLAIGFSYTFYLKNVVIFDIFCIASGFLLRVLAGAVVIDVPISNWILICTIFLSLFLALGKRRSEMVLLQTDAVQHRSVLSEYSLSFIDQMITIVTASTILSYVLYTLSEETVAKFHTKNLKYTIIFVVYGIFRYLYLIYQKKKGGAPEKLLFSDRPLLVNIVLFVLVAMAAIYF